VNKKEMAKKRLLPILSALYTAVWAYTSHPEPNKKIKHFIGAMAGVEPDAKFGRLFMYGLYPLVASTVVSGLLDWADLNPSFKGISL